MSGELDVSSQQWGDKLALGRFLRQGQVIVLNDFGEGEMQTHKELKGIYGFVTLDDAGLYRTEQDATGERVIFFSSYSGVTPYSDEKRRDTVDAAWDTLRRSGKVARVNGYDSRTDFKVDSSSRLLRSHP